MVELRLKLALGACCAALLVLLGCSQHSSEVAAGEALAVNVATPTQRQVTDYIDFTGRTDAVQSVNIVPRVTGYLTKLAFKEGSEVKVGDQLFEVDPRPYQAQYDQGQGQVTLAEAQVKVARADNARATELLKTPGAISPQDVDHFQATEEEALAAVKAAKASLELNTLNLSFCKITSPIDGQIGRYLLTLGNLVNQDTTLLTTIVSLDPMYVYFDMDEPTLLRIRRAVNEGRIKPPENGVLPVLIGLQGEDGFPHTGEINFVNNTVNSATGSITVRGQVDNPKGAGGRRLLSPGMFVRVELPIGGPHPALLVFDQVIGSDLGNKYVYTVDANNTVQTNAVQTGALQPDGLRVIISGLKPTDRVVCSSILQVRPNTKVNPVPLKQMPSLGADASATEGTPAGETPPGGATAGKKPPVATPDNSKSPEPAAGRQ